MLGALKRFCLARDRPVLFPSLRKNVLDRVASARYLRLVISSRRNFPPPLALSAIVPDERRRHLQWTGALAVPHRLASTCWPRSSGSDSPGHSCQFSGTVRSNKVIISATTRARSPVARRRSRRRISQLSATPMTSSVTAPGTCLSGLWSQSKRGLRTSTLFWLFPDEGVGRAGASVPG